MTPTPPPTFNFVEGKDPVLTRGQYDYHLATEDELYEGYDDPMFPGLRVATAGAPAKVVAKAAEKKTEKKTEGDDE
jgi:hypothetical protein